MAAVAVIVDLARPAADKAVGRDGGYPPDSGQLPGCGRIFEEAAPGGRWDRPGLHRMLDQLREGDVVVVWKLDPPVVIAERLKDVLHIMERSGAAAGFRSLTEAIDTTTPAGRMMMRMVGAFAPSPSSSAP